MFIINILTTNPILPNMEIWKYGNMEIWKYGNMEIWKYGNMEIWKYGNPYVKNYTSFNLSCQLFFVFFYFKNIKYHLNF